MSPHGDDRGRHWPTCLATTSSRTTSGERGEYRARPTLKGRDRKRVGEGKERERERVRERERESSEHELTRRKCLAESEYADDAAELPFLSAVLQ